MLVTPPRLSESDRDNKNAEEITSSNLVYKDLALKNSGNTNILTPALCVVICKVVFLIS